MADLPVPVHFDLIEAHKENIQPLTSGRSARALVAALNTQETRDGQRTQHMETRTAFETELLTSQELDDPLEVWVRYINWTIEAYPSGHNSESGLLPLLERATKQFLHEAHYKNDPRYLKFWIYYIQNFSEAQREHFSYLARNEVGQKLALFYEEFAALLESLGRKKQAKEIYELGIENNARPAERLLRKYSEFIRRYEANPPAVDEPSSPALPAMRPALAAKALPFGGGDGGAPLEPQTQQGGPAGHSGPKAPRQKLAVFADGEDKGGSALPIGGGPVWDSIGTLEHRKKENTMEPRPWAGETLKQSGAGGKALGGDRIPIFRDTSNQSSAFNPVPAAVPGKRPERVVANLNAIYTKDHDPTHEFSFEELRAMKRGLFGVNWGKIHAEEAAAKQKRQQQQQQRSIEPFADLISNSPKAAKTQTIKAKLQSPSPGKGRLKKRSQQARSGSPTMTINTRAAMDDVYDIFNQPIDHPNKDLDAESSSYDDDDGDDLTTMTTASRPRGGDSDSGDSDSGDAASEWDDSTRKNIEYLDETVGLTDDTYYQKFNNQNRDDDDDDEDESGSDPRGAISGENSEDEEDDDEPGLPMKPRRLFTVASDSPPRAQFSENSPRNNQPFVDRSRMYMTPIVEQTEMSLPGTTAKRKAASKTPSRPRAPPTAQPGKGGRQAKAQPAMSSPFEELADEDFLPPPPAMDLNASPPAPAPAPAPVAAAAPKPTAVVPKKAAPVKDLGPVTKETQVNPMDPDLREQIISRLSPPLSTYEGYYNYLAPGSGKAEAIKRQLRPASKNKEHGTVDKAVLVSFAAGGGGKSYTFKKQIGEGAFAPIYLAENSTVADFYANEQHSSGDERGDENARPKSLPPLPPHLHNRELMEAVKFINEPPTTPWEFYIMRQIHRRLGVSRPTDSLLKAHECHVFGKELYLILPFQRQGTLLDLVNLAAKEALTAKGTPGQGVDEVLAMFLTVELLRTLEAIHSKGILHGDLKADNCLVRFEPVPGGDGKWESQYRRDGGGGWAHKGIMLIDFGRGIDMKQFVPNVQFIADWKADPQQDCAEMREMRPWTYQIDYHGAAGVIHGLLFGKFMETVAEKTGAVGIGGGGGKGWKVKEPFKRYWQGEIWGKCFDVLLNPGRHVSGEDSATAGAGGLPVTRALRKVREEMETWLEANSEKGVGLRNCMRKLEGLLAANAPEGVGRRR